MELSQDYSMGSKVEKNLVAFLNQDGANYSLYKNEFSTYDFTNGEYICEVKSRRNCYKKYPSTMVGYNKIQVAESNSQNKYRFYFVFTDGTYYWDFVKDQYEVNIGGRSDRGRPEYKPYAYINIENLTLFTTEIKSIS